MAEGLGAFAKRKRQEREAKSKKRVQKRQSQRTATRLLTKEERKVTRSGEARVTKLISDSELSRQASASASGRGRTAEVFRDQGQFFVRESPIQESQTVTATQASPQAMTPAPTVRVGEQAPVIPAKTALPSEFEGGFGAGGRFQEPFFTKAGQRERALNVGAVFKEIFFHDTPGDTATLQARGISGKGALLVETAAEHPFLTAGVAASGTLLVGGVVGAVGASVPAVAGTAGLTTAAATVPGGVTVLSFTGAGLSAASTAFATHQIIESIGTTSAEAESLRNVAVKESFGSTISRQAAGIGVDQGTVKNIVGKDVTKGRGVIQKGLFAVSTLTGSKDEFGAISKQELESRGITDPVAVSALQKRRVAAGTGEIAGFTQVSVSSEIGGRAGQTVLSGKLPKLTSTGAKLFSQQASRTAVAIFPAGVLEGATSVGIQQTSRGRSTNFGEIAIGGVLGGTSAGIIGGGIAGLATIGKKAGSRAVETVASILDPFEKPGDIIASGIGRATTKGAITTVPVLTTTFTSTPSNVPSTSQSFTSTPVQTFTSTPSQTFTSTPASTPTVVPSSTFRGVPTITPINIPTRTHTNIPIDVPVPIDDPVIVPDPVIIPDPVVIPSITNITNTTTNIPTTVPVSVPTTVPTVTPTFRFTPPLTPLLLGGGGGGSAFGTGFNRGVGSSFGFTQSLGGAVFGVGQTASSGKLFSGLGFRTSSKTKKKKKKGGTSRKSKRATKKARKPRRSAADAAIRLRR